MACPHVSPLGHQPACPSRSAAAFHYLAAQLLCVTQQPSPAAVSSPVGEVGHVIHDTFFVSGGTCHQPSSTWTFTQKTLVGADEERGHQHLPSLAKSSVASCSIACPGCWGECRC